MYVVLWMSPSIYEKYVCKIIEEYNYIMCYMLYVFRVWIVKNIT